MERKEVVYVVGLYINVEEVDKAKTFGGKGRVYLLGALYEALTLPPKTLVVHFVPLEKLTVDIFTALRLNLYSTVPRLLPASAYVSLDADLVLSDNFHSTILNIFKQHVGFGGCFGPKMGEGNWLKWFREIIYVQRELGKPDLMPYRIVAGLWGMRSPYWEMVAREAERMCQLFYSKHPELRGKGWGEAPFEEAFLTLALTPFYRRGLLKVYVTGVDAKKMKDMEPFPDPEFRYPTTHGQGLRFFVPFLKEKLRGYLNIKVADALRLIEERQYVYTKGELRG